MKKIPLPLVLLSASVVALITCGLSAYLLEIYPLVWQISGGLTILFALAYLSIEHRRVAGQLGQKSTQFGLHTLVLVMLSLGVVTMINMIANRYDVKADVTKNKLHTLSEQTVKVIKGLNQEIVIKLFVPANAHLEYDRILGRYLAENPKLKREFVDADKDPLAVTRYQVRSLGTMVIESANRSNKVDNISGTEDPKFEEKLTNAIIQVAKGTKKKIYFTTGHGERLITDTGREGYSATKEELANGRYDVAELMLLDKDKIPADAEILVVAGSRTDFIDHEIKLIEGYVRAGGNLLFMVEPTSSPKLKSFLAAFGVDWTPKRTVVEMNPLQQFAGGNPLTPIIGKYDTSHEVTRSMNQPSLLAISAPVEKLKTTPEGLTVTNLFSTGAQSYDVPLVSNKVQVNPKTDRSGPISLALAVTGKVTKSEAAQEPKEGEAKPEQPEFRMLVVGDSDFASNAVRTFGMNADLFQNMLSWLAQEEDLIAVRPKATDEAKLEVTSARLKVINLLSMIVLPLVLFVVGLLTFLIRRRM